MEFIFYYIYGISFKIWFVCGRGGCYMYMYIKNVLLCLLCMLKLLVLYFNFCKFDYG